MLGKLKGQWVLASETTALDLVQPETVLRWHRHGCRLFWRRKSKRTGTPPRIGAVTIGLIETMARNNRLWGAERIRGERLKLNVHVAKRTIQRYMRRVRQPRPPGQRWATLLRNHAHETWACDFLQTYDLLFRPIVAFFVIALGSRRVVHVGVTRSPSSAWVAQQLREATPWGEGPRFLIRDNDDKFGARFDEVAAGTGIEILRTPGRAPNANAFCERFLRSGRAECLDHYQYEYEVELGLPWKSRDVWVKLSSSFFDVEKVTTPTLFMCGQLDMNVPLLNTEQLYQAVRRIGKADTELVIYPNQWHGIETPSYRKDRYERYIAWYDRYLKPASAITEGPTPEATSLLGRPLYAPEMAPEARESAEKALEQARADFVKSPDSADAIVWLGRRLSALGRIRESIEVYTRGIARFPAGRCSLAGVRNRRSVGSQA